jgi:hypothetical protein
MWIKEKTMNNVVKERNQSHICEKCKLPIEKNHYAWTTFKNGATAIKATCSQCGIYLGYVPKCHPFTVWAKGNYAEPKKDTTEVKLSPSESILASIINIPGIEQYIGKLLYDKAVAVLRK